MNILLEEGICECISEPMGENGLEGYNVGDRHKFQHMGKDRNGKTYFRIYSMVDETYYETCGTGTFNTFFKKIKNEPDK